MFTFGRAALLLGLIWPGADSSFVVVDESTWAGDHVELAIDAVVELITDVAFFMGKVTVLPWAMLTWLRFL